MIEDEKFDLSVGRIGLRGWGEIQPSQRISLWHKFKIFIISFSACFEDIRNYATKSDYHMIFLSHEHFIAMKVYHLHLI